MDVCHLLVLQVHHGPFLCYMVEGKEVKPGIKQNNLPTLNQNLAHAVITKDHQHHNRLFESTGKSRCRYCTGV